MNPFLPEDQIIPFESDEDRARPSRPATVGDFSEALSGLYELTPASPLIRGVMRSTPMALFRGVGKGLAATVDPGNYGFSGRWKHIWEQMNDPDMVHWQEQNYTDVPARRKILSAIFKDPDKVQGAEKLLALRDRLLVPVGHVASELYTFGIPAASNSLLSTISGPLLRGTAQGVGGAAAAASHAAFSAANLKAAADQILEPVIYAVTGRDAYRDRINAEKHAKDVYADVVRDIYASKDLTAKQKSLLLEGLHFTSIGDKAKAEEYLTRVDKLGEQGQATAPELTPETLKQIRQMVATKRKPFNIWDYKGEIGFGALGGLAGYGIGHLLKFKLPLKILSAITGAAMGAYGYNKLKSS